jgi:hypothetical protein
MAIQSPTPTASPARKTADAKSTNPNPTATKSAEPETTDITTPVAIAMKDKEAAVEPKAIKATTANGKKLKQKQGSVDTNKSSASATKLAQNQAAPPGIKRKQSDVRSGEKEERPSKTAKPTPVRSKIPM